MSRKMSRIGQFGLAVVLMGVMTVGTAGVVMADGTEAGQGTTKDVWIDNTVDNSVSYVSGIVVVDEEENTLYNAQADVPFSNPRTDEVNALIDEARGAVEKEAGEKNYSEYEIENEETTGKVWDNRKYETIEDGDAVLIGDADYMQGAYGVSDPSTRTHVASGDYGKETFFRVLLRVIRQKAEEEKHEEETAAGEEPAGEPSAEDSDGEQPAADESAAAPEKEPEQEAPPVEPAAEPVAAPAETVVKLEPVASASYYAVPAKVGEAMAVLLYADGTEEQVPVSSLIITVEELLAQLTDDEKTAAAVQAFVEQEKGRGDVEILKLAAVNPQVFGSAVKAVVPLDYAGITAGTKVTFTFEGGITVDAEADGNGIVKATFEQAGVFSASVS